MRAALRAAARIAAAAAIPILCGTVVAGLFDLDSNLLAVLLIATVAAAAVAAIAVGLRNGILDLLRPASDVKVARFVEERVTALRAASIDSPQPFDDALVSAAEEIGADAAGDAGFRGLLVDNAADRLAAIGPAQIVPAAALRRAALEAAAGLASFVLALVIASSTVGRAIEEGWVRLFPGSVSVRVQPGNVRVRPGQPILITATVTTRGKALDRVAPVVTISGPGRPEQSFTMTRLDVESPWMFSAPVDGSFTYRVIAGSARSQEYTVTALLPARAERIELDYDYPSFTRLPPRHEDDGGDIYAPAGTKVRVRIHTDKPVASGRLTLAESAQAPLTPESDRLLEGSLLLTKDDSYRVALVDADGLSSPGETEFFIRVMDDRPPDVRIMRPAGDQQITPLEEVVIEARADDDHGIASLDLVYAVAGRAPRVVPLGAGSAEAQRSGSVIVAAEDLKVQPGDVISYYARARDVGRGKPSSETRSDMFFLEVRPFSEEFVSAQSQAMAGAAGDQLEALIAAQKEIINATWGIERRAAAGAGRSAADVAAIASAQIELKGRAEQMAPGRGRGPFRFPMQLQPPRTRRPGADAPDPVAAAISAMGRAVDRLQNQRPGDALAHEMAALQGLLQAQAEIRRREVGQASAGAGGMGRQGQDLSALFDKELQRQQRTNYETQSRVEETSDREKNQSALDRIRDLARRQEELGEKQRALADANVAAEERKRQLERLTREQETLRQQAEDLARQLGQQQQSSSQQGSRDGSSEMRAASEQMRGAAGDLQRQDAAGAAQRAGRAAAQLRRLEQQMQGDSAGARERAAGELRMEAQQIADEQQRIAGEAERLDKGAPDQDALRRLAGEKDKLADRVDELRRSTERLATIGRSEGGSQASEVERQTAGLAKEIEGQRIAERMRETAKQMREGDAAGRRGRAGQPASAGKLSGPERQLAQELARAVDRLGAADGDAGVANTLDQTRRMREALSRAEQRLREAEARASNGNGRQGRGAGPGGAAATGELERLRRQYAQTAQRTREELSRLERGTPGSGAGGISPETHEWSVTDQGTEGFKQDFSDWESLKQDVESALERYEAAAVGRALRGSLQDRLNAGGSDRVPDAYRKLIARYYESLARKK
jgi:hypothetical protein